MGAIQQAFNQALGYAAIAAGPAVAKQKEISAAERQRQMAVTAKQGIYEKKKEAAEVVAKNVSSERKGQLSADLAAAATELYNINPTPEVLETKLKHEKLASRYSKMAEAKTKEAAETTAARKQQIQEQKDIMKQFMSNIPQSYPIKEVIK